MGCVLPQERKANITTIQPAEAKTAIIYRRIGSITYKVRVHFSETAKETMNDKILHLIQREAVTNGADCGTMKISELVEKLAEQYGWSSSVPNLSDKLRRESLRYKETVELADALGYDLIWQKRR